MKIPLSWISLYSDVSSLLEKYEAKALAHEYSIHTAEIDGIEISYLDKVVVGKVRSCINHPDSKKLSIVEVDLWEHGTTIILTGAANIVDAHFVPVAMVGAVLPWDFTIGERMMAGMMSRGMICSDDELGLASGEADGIMILEQIWDSLLLESMIGRSFYDLEISLPGIGKSIYTTKIRDTVFEIDNKFITNRPDLFSVVGNAREFHTVFETPFVPYTSQEILPKETLETEILSDRVLSYHLLGMEGIEVDDTPWGLSLMMHRAGLTPKMDIVDITNCIMTELGQPMHAFDAAKIAWHIIVRMARAWETLLALNGNEYILTTEDIVIADTKKVLAIAGVIGGMESAVSRETKEIYWESACFDPSSVRFTSQRLGLRTDASTRYEKSLDPLLAPSGITRAIEYMKFLWKKYEMSGYSGYINASRVNHIAIEVTHHQINSKIGVMIPAETLEWILGRLGFQFTKIESADSWTIAIYSIVIPSWRATKDIAIWEDIAEEIGRVYGYDKVEENPLTANFRISKKNQEIDFRNRTNTYFSQLRWYETYHYSFSNETLDKKIGYSSMDEAIGIVNAFNEEYTHMRRSLAPRLLLSAWENLKHKKCFSLFELGKTFHKPWTTSSHSHSWTLASPFHQKKSLAWVVVGSPIETLKKHIEGYLFETLGYVPPIHEGDFSVSVYHPGISGRYQEGGTTIISFGRLHPEVAHQFELPSDTLYFEADYEKLLTLSTEKDIIFQEIQKFPTIERELNFIIGETTQVGPILRTIDSFHPWIMDVWVVSTYRDLEKIGEDKKSVTFRFELVNREATITDTEALEIQNLVIDRMEESGYSLRR